MFFGARSVLHQAVSALLLFGKWTFSSDIEKGGDVCDKSLKHLWDGSGKLLGGYRITLAFIPIIVSTNSVKNLQTCKPHLQQLSIMIKEVCP
jgi:hypothetical protein